MTQYIEITPSAEEYLAELLEKQNVEGMAVRIFITPVSYTHLTLPTKA